MKKILIVSPHFLPRGALPEIVRDGIDGFLVNTREQAVSAIGKLSNIKRADCRQRAETQYSSRQVVINYLKLYSQIEQCQTH